MQISTNPRAFTLVEMLVVVTIIGVLIALALPALSSALAKSRQTKCLSNLKQIALASELYTADNDGYVVPAFLRTQSGSGTTTNHWNTTLLEFYNRSSNEVASRADFSCSNWKEVGDGYTNWNWGYAINETPLYPNSNRTTRVTIDSNGNADKQPARIIAITHPSQRLQFCCGKDWHVTFSNVADYAAMDRHGEGKCNVVFFDGHAETLKPDQVIQAVENPGNE